MGEEAGIEAVLDALYAERGLDFRLYRRSTIAHRLSHRLAAVRAPDYRSYLHMLASDPAEFDHLIGHLTLKVTGFFRNGPVFAQLRSTVLPALLARSERLAVWSAGCATGEEPYSVAILLAELCAGRERRPEVTIVGSDIDESALATARAGCYATAAVKEMSPALLSRWLVPERKDRGMRYALREEVREGVHFVWHNLSDATGPPPGAAPAGFDLVLCRNVLIYFQRPLQGQVVDLLDRGLRPGGYLVLGEAESLPGSMETQYCCLDRRARVYRKMRQGEGGDGTDIA